jgi:hypothetical protein
LSTQGLLGGIGAAVAAAKVMTLDESGITTAIGLVAKRAAGIAIHDGQPLHPGARRALWVDGSAAGGQLVTAYPDAAAERILGQAWRIEECPQVDQFCKELTTGVCRT